MMIPRRASPHTYVGIYDDGPPSRVLNVARSALDGARRAFVQRSVFTEYTLLERPGVSCPQIFSFLLLKRHLKILAGHSPSPSGIPPYLGGDV